MSASQPYSVFIQNPQNGNKIDFSQFVHVLSEFDADQQVKAGQGGRNLILRAIRLLNVTVHDPAVTDPVDLASLYAELYRLADAFDSIEEIIHEVGT